MKWSYALALMIAVSACSDDDGAAPCTGPCEAELKITTFTVQFPTPGTDTIPTSYSGDTVRVHVEITNVGEARSDSMRLTAGTAVHDDVAVQAMRPRDPADDRHVIPRCHHLGGSTEQDPALLVNR